MSSESRPIGSEPGGGALSHTEQAYQTLRDLVLSMEMAPGLSLSERGLEARLGSSRTPVRAALARLESEGLVMRDGRGYVVAPIDLVEIEKAFEFRLMIECASVRAAIRRATLQQMISAVPASIGRTPAGEPVREYLQNATEFHLAIARLTQNEYFTRALGDVLTRLARVRALGLQTRAGRQRAWSEHQRIIGLLRLRDEEGAVAEITRHLESSYSRLSARLSQARPGRDLKVALLTGAGDRA